MARTLSFLLLGLSLLFPATTVHAQVWSLVWSDEFDVDGLPDPARWSYDVGGGGWGNNELQFYTENDPDNARVENGLLVIEAHKESFQGNAYTSARLVSREQGGLDLRAHRGPGARPRRTRHLARHLDASRPTGIYGDGGLARHRRDRHHGARRV
ncbi:MAG: hypothetical protein KatS3mg042_1388 [Rhodothermaceae bacterium]|nr:MAG: hypothetical protein KatS3mg042_1388 [Rhodothermaceae bacterium]